MNALDMLNKCIEEMESMTQQEFDNIMMKKNLNCKKYNVDDYVGGNFDIVLPKESKIKVNLVENYIYNQLKININNKMLFKNNASILRKSVYVKSSYTINKSFSNMNYIVRRIINDNNTDEYLIKKNDDLIFNKNKDIFLKAA